MFFVNKLISTEKIASAKEGVRVTDSKKNHLNTSIQRLYTWTRLGRSGVIQTWYSQSSHWCTFRMHAWKLLRVYRAEFSSLCYHFGRVCVKACYYTYIYMIARMTNSLAI
jgi:hypothetical protein